MLLVIFIISCWFLESLSNICINQDARITIALNFKPWMNAVPNWPLKKCNGCMALDNYRLHYCEINRLIFLINSIGICILAVNKNCTCLIIRKQRFQEYKESVGHSSERSGWVLENIIFWHRPRKQRLHGRILWIWKVWSGGECRSMVDKLGCHLLLIRR